MSVAIQRGGFGRQTRAQIELARAEAALAVAREFCQRFLDFVADTLKDRPIA